MFKIFINLEVVKNPYFYKMSILFLGSLFFLSSCKKDRLALLVVEQHTPTQASVHDIVVIDENTSYAVGGVRWEHGEYLQTHDGGTTWLSDTLANSELNNLSFPNNNHGYIVGFRTKYFHKDFSSTNNWEFKQLDTQEALHGVAFYDENLGIAVGGGSFHTGLIFRFNNSNGIPDTLIYPIEHEMRDVCFLDANTAIAVGYGIVLKSTDGGLNWTPNAIDGDFFYSVHFPNALVGYSIGFTGAIIKTTDGGESWKKLRNGNKLFTSREKFRDVFFTTPDIGYIVGDKGLFWKTEDGADSWKIIEMPEVDLNAIHVRNGKGHIAADDGRIFVFED